MSQIVVFWGNGRLKTQILLQGIFECELQAPYYSGCGAGNGLVWHGQVFYQRIDVDTHDTRTSYWAFSKPGHVKQGALLAA